MNQSGKSVIAVTGATGFVGRWTVRALLDAGYAVRGLIRDGEKAKDVLPAHDDLTWVEGDALKPDTLRDLCADCRGVVHTIGIRREIPRLGVTFARLHVAATKNVLDAAAEAGVGRYVHISALGVRPEAGTKYQQSKWEGEQLVRKSGLDWTILRPSIIHGPDGEFIQMIKDWTLGRAAPRFFLPYFQRFEGVSGKPPVPKFVSAQVAPVRVEDVAFAVVRSLEKDEAVGEVYHLAGPETLDWPSLLTHVRDSLPMSSRKPALGLPAPAGVAMALGARVLGLSEALPFGPSEPAMAAEDNTADTHKAIAHLGFDPKPFRESVAAYADQV